MSEARAQCGACPRWWNAGDLHAVPSLDLRVCTLCWNTILHLAQTIQLEQALAGLQRGHAHTSTEQRLARLLHIEGIPAHGDQHPSPDDAPAGVVSGVAAPVSALAAPGA